MTGRGHRARPLWHDRALESPRAGWILTGIACSFALLGVALAAVDVAAGAAWWAYALLALWPPLVWFIAWAGRTERARAAHHHKVMDGYRESITDSFNALEALHRERGGQL